MTCSRAVQAVLYSCELVLYLLQLSAVVAAVFVLASLHKLSKFRPTCAKCAIAQTNGVVGEKPDGQALCKGCQTSDSVSGY